MNTITLETETAKKNITSKEFTFIFDSEIQKMMIGQAFEFLVNQANNQIE
jgi:ribosomal protein L23